MQQLQTSVRVRPYSAISPSTRKIIMENTKLHKMVIGLGWSIEKRF